MSWLKTSDGREEKVETSNSTQVPGELSASKLEACGPPYTPGCPWIEKVTSC